MENFSKSGGKILSNYVFLISEVKLGNWSIKLHIVIITIISTSDIVSSSSFTVPREERNFFVTRYVQVLFDLNSKKQAQFTVPLVFGL